MPRNDDHKVARIKRHHYLAKNHIYLYTGLYMMMRSLSKYLCVYEGLYFRQSIKWMSWGGGGKSENSPSWTFATCSTQPQQSRPGTPRSNGRWSLSNRDSTRKVGQGRRPSNGRWNHSDGDITSKVGQGCRPANGRWSHPNGDITSKNGTGMPHRRQDPQQCPRTHQHHPGTSKPAGVFFQNGGIQFIWIVHTRRESVGVLRVTGSLLHLVLACRLAVLCDCSSCIYLQVPWFRVDALEQIVCVVGDIHRTVPQDNIVDAMASENSQPGADDFRVHVKSRGMLRNQ